MAEEKYHGPGPEQRIAARLKPSNDHSTADHHHVAGSGARRTVSTIHGSGSQAAHGHGPLSPEGSEGDQ